MAPEAPSMQVMLDRLEKLERQNRRLKQIGAAVLVTLSSLMLMAQTTSHKVLEAGSFVLIDQNGKHSAELSTAGGLPGLTIYGTGKGNVWIGAGNDGPFVSLEALGGGMAGTLLTLKANERGAHVSLSGRSGSAWLELSKSGPHVSLEAASADHGPSSRLYPDALVIEDEEGFHSVLGVSSTVRTRTGEKHQTSAAALTMFDKDGKVIWEAPQP
jgi:hypothetical protein